MNTQRDVTVMLPCLGTEALDLDLVVIACDAVVERAGVLSVRVVPVLCVVCDEGIACE